MCDVNASEDQECSDVFLGTHEGCTGSPWVVGRGNCPWLVPWSEFSMYLNE